MYSQKVSCRTFGSHFARPSTLDNLVEMLEQGLEIDTVGYGAVFQGLRLCSQTPEAVHAEFPENLYRIRVGPENFVKGHFSCNLGHGGIL